MATSDSAPLLLNISGIPSEVEKDDIEDYFSRRKLGGGEAKLLNLDEGEAVVSIKNLDSKGGSSLVLPSPYPMTKKKKWSGHSRLGSFHFLSHL